MDRIPDGTPLRTVGGHVRAVVRKLLTGPRPRPRAPHPTRAARSAHKYQALVAPLPRSGQAPAGADWPATWRGVARTDRARQLLTALVTRPEGLPPPPGRSPLTVTLVVVGPGDCLEVGDDFTLWQGSDVARGVVTRRLFV